MGAVPGEGTWSQVPRTRRTSRGLREWRGGGPSGDTGTGKTRDSTGDDVSRSRLPRREWPHQTSSLELVPTATARNPPERSALRCVPNPLDRVPAVSP